MKLIGITFIACLLLAMAANAQQADTNAAPKLTPAFGMGVLSEDKIAELKQTFTDPKTKKSYAFFAEAGLPSMDKKTLEKYQKSGKVPFLITASLYEVREVRGKKSYDRQNGTCNIYMQDKEGKVLFSKTQSLSKMCLS
jgi:hypothetical protein